MATPDFIKAVRAKAGNRLLFLPGVTAVVYDDRERVLLVRRSDNGRWTLVGGIPDPGEQPAAAVVREVLEETAVRCEALRVVLVETEPEPVVYPNGDRCQYMNITFRCRATGGEARVNDDESSEVGWFPPDALPPLSGLDRHRIDRSRTDAPTWFAAPSGG
ncbi:NUDIX domain-containing protein [Streptomyces sp. MUM 203J]|uniref:NUDIX hydrolase n=1 Tax=Streptomyces sp. MUM 203J TaxID=2791990 RepID=UPI001F03D9C7|nr:NUDIX domain-containing protein [Streptomyces sp. MUM 203J]MCH0540833.1 NUDIX domain-containing protein [Streptomyces sp. MUM 203J]